MGRLKILSLCFVLFISCKASPDKAKSYYKDIISPIEDVLLKEDLLISQINNEMQKGSKDSLPSVFQTENKVDNNKNDDIKFSLNNLALQVETSLNKIENIREFNEDIPLKNATTELLMEYKSLCSNEFVKLTEIVSKPSFEYSDTDDSDFLTLTEEIDKKLQKKIDHFTKTAKDFAFFYNFEIQENTTNKIDN